MRERSLSLSEETKRRQRGERGVPVLTEETQTEETEECFRRTRNKWLTDLVQTEQTSAQDLAPHAEPGEPFLFLVH